MSKIQQIDQQFYQPVIQAANKGANLLDLFEIVVKQGNILYSNYHNGKLLAEQPLTLVGDEPDLMHTVVGHGCIYAGHEPKKEVKVLGSQTGASKKYQPQDFNNESLNNIYSKDQIFFFGEAFSKYFTKNVKADFSADLVVPNPGKSLIAISNTSFKTAFATGAITTEKVNQHYGVYLCDMSFPELSEVKGSLIFPSKAEVSLSKAIASSRISKSIISANKPFSEVTISNIETAVKAAHEQILTAIEGNRAQNIAISKKYVSMNLNHYHY